ncbi:MAG: hypothetical protein GY799_17650 [Desulfobulbaceae bacterium]|nr:hypothetical protein [Desulfobulbaceae bacterium]
MKIYNNEADKRRLRMKSFYDTINFYGAEFSEIAGTYSMGHGQGQS